MPPVFDIPQRVENLLKAMGISLWLYAAIQFVSSFVLSLAGSLFHLDGSSIYEAVSMFAMVTASGLGAFLAGMNATGQKLEPPKKPDHLLTVLGGSLCLMYAVSLVCGIGETLFNSLFGGLGLQLEQPEFFTSWSTTGKILEFVTIGLAGPILEELFFRRFLFKSLKPYGVVFAALFSSLCFGMMHMNFSQGIPVFFFGLIFCAAYEKSQSLVAPILLHIANNSLSCAITFWPGFSMAFGLLVIVLAVAGVAVFAYCVPKLSRILSTSREHWWKDVLHCPWLTAFGIFFLIMAVGNLL